MPIESLLRRPVATLPPDARCSEAAKLMRDENIGAVVVADADGRPLGLVTDRDLVVRVIAGGEDAETLRLRDVMSAEPIYRHRGRSIDQVIATMRDLAIRRIPIVDDDGRLRGVVTMDDLLILLADQLGALAETVRQEIKPPA